MRHRISTLPPLGVVESDGTPLDLPLGKPFAVLAYLAAHDGRVSRDDLAALLWPGAAPDRARASVRQALWVLRQELGPDAIREDPDLTLDRTAVEVDVDEFRRRLDRGEALAAYEMWNEGFLHGLGVAGAAGWDEWVDSARGEYEGRLGRMLADEGAVCRASVDLDGARIRLEAALSVQPYLQERHLELADLLLEMGELGEAGALLDRARAWVDQPDPALLAEAEQRLARLRERGGDAHGEVEPLRLEFVGRGAAVDRLRAADRSARSGRPRTVVVEGPAGIGKTRLVTEYLRGGPPAEWVLARVKLTEGDRTLPWAFLAELVRMLAGERGASGVSAVSARVLAALSPSLAPALGVTEAPPLPEKAAVADAVYDLVDAVAGESGLVLWVDDCQWCDGESLEVLLRVLRMVGSGRILALLACRSGEADRAALRSLYRTAEAGRAEVLTLTPLTDADLRELLAFTVRFRHPEVLGDVAARLAAFSRGIPLVVETVLRGLVDQGALVRSDDGWLLTLDDARGMTAPPPLRDWLARRIEVLPPEGAAVLAELVRSARPLSDEELRARLAEETLDVHALDAALASLREQGLAVSVEGRHAPAHDLVREVARAELAALRSRDSMSAGTRVAAGVVLAAGLAAAVWAVGAGAVGRPATPPVLPRDLEVVVRQESGITRFRSARDGSGLVAAGGIVAPPGVWLGDVVRLADGRLAVAALSVPEGRSAPDALVYFPEADRTTVLADGAADDGTVAIAADGRSAVVMTADSVDGVYRSHFYRVDLRTGQRRALYAPSTGIRTMVASPRGRMLVFPGGPSDSLLLLDFQGRRLDAFPPRDHRPVAARWCGERAVVLTSFPSGEPARHEILDTRDGSSEAVDLMPGATGVACHGEGRWIAWGEGAAGGARLVVEDRVGGGRLSTDLPGVSLVAPQFLPVQPPAVAVALDVPAGLEVEWGETVEFTAVPVGVDGRPADVEALEWVSRDPAVAGITAGRVTGNGPGSTVLVAEVDGRPLDSLPVTVPAAPRPADALFGDRFGTGAWAERWIAFGNPAVTIGSDGSEPFLDIWADGSGADGITTADEWTLPRGATVEFEFDLPLGPRRDRQSVRLCLHRTAHESGTPVGGPPVDMASAGYVCAIYPTGEHGWWDPRSIAFGSSRMSLGSIPLSDDQVPDEWTHLAIQVRPDGEGSLVLDRRVVFRHAGVMPAIARGPWRVAVFARTVDTRLRIRNVVLREGIRYGPEGPLAGS
ncbi:MAG: AAA family ATPase [Longimicrobiales bacterium]